DVGLHLLHAGKLHGANQAQLAFLGSECQLARDPGVMNLKEGHSTYFPASADERYADLVGRVEELDEGVFPLLELGRMPNQHLRKLVKTGIVHFEEERTPARSLADAFQAV